MERRNVTRAVIAGLLLVISIGLLIFAIVHFVHNDSGSKTAQTGSSQKVAQGSKPAPKPNAKSNSKSSAESSNSGSASSSSGSPHQDSAGNAGDNASSGSTGSAAANGTSSGPQDLAHTGPAGVMTAFAMATALGAVGAHFYQRKLRHG